MIGVGSKKEGDADMPPQPFDAACRWWPSIAHKVERPAVRRGMSILPVLAAAGIRQPNSATSLPPCLGICCLP
ncbi:MAG: hypothetical protein D6753_17450 [Planctomycetota bacterium]|nr:MAG: hypothetical protein D6753_17450 [Planctomycetota bacterium]